MVSQTCMFMMARKFAAHAARGQGIFTMIVLLTSLTNLCQPSKFANLSGYFGRFCNIFCLISQLLLSSPLVLFWFSSGQKPANIAATDYEKEVYTENHRAWLKMLQFGIWKA